MSIAFENIMMFAKPDFVNQHRIADFQPSTHLCFERRQPRPWPREAPDERSSCHLAARRSCHLVDRRSCRRAASRFWRRLACSSDPPDRAHPPAARTGRRSRPEWAYSRLKARRDTGTAQPPVEEPHWGPALPPFGASRAPLRSEETTPSQPTHATSGNETKKSVLAEMQRCPVIMLFCFELALNWLRMN